MRVTHYRLALAYGLLPGTFSKINFPAATVELLIWKGGGRPGTCASQSPQVLLVTQAWGPRRLGAWEGFTVTQGELSPDTRYRVIAGSLPGP